MLKLLKVAGNSLSPFIQEGDFVLVLKIPFFFINIHSGDIVAFHHSIYGVMIKQVEHLSSDKEEIFVIGRHPDSIDSRHFGPIHTRELIGKVICHIRKPVANL